MGGNLARLGPSPRARRTCGAVESILPSKLGAKHCITRMHTRNRSMLVITAAKKGGKSKKGKKSKAPSTVPQSSNVKPYLSTPVIMQNLLLIESYFRKTGRPLFDHEFEIQDVAQLLWEAPFALVSHDTSEDPKVTYANRACLDLFEAEWDEMIGVPSKNTAPEEGEIRDERSAMLKEALKNGYVDDYQGVRVSFKGNTFTISNSTIFTIESPGGRCDGAGCCLEIMGV
jgi:hypothetical protein